MNDLVTKTQDNRKSIEAEKDPIEEESRRAPGTAGTLVSASILKENTGEES